MTKSKKKKQKTNLPKLQRIIKLLRIILVITCFALIVLSFFTNIINNGIYSKILHNVINIDFVCILSLIVLEILNKRQK